MGLLLLFLNLKTPTFFTSSTTKPTSPTTKPL